MLVFHMPRGSNLVSSAFYKPWTSLASSFLSLNPSKFSFNASAKGVL